MKGALLALPLLVAFTLPVHAYQLSPKPETGLWRSEIRILVADEERIHALQQAQQQMFEQLPGERRAALDDAISQSTPQIRMECITTQRAEELVQIESLQQEIQRDVPECELTVHPVDRSTLSVLGHCHGEQGFNGEMQGHLEIISSYEIRASYLGRGRERGATGSETTSSIQLQEISRWTAEDCGDVTPPERLSF